MKKQEIWFALSPLLYSAMKDYADKTGLPKVRSKCLLYLFYNYNPASLEKDYSFNHEHRKMVCIKADAKEIEHIQSLTTKYGRNNSALARDIVYTYLKEHNAL